MMMLNEPYCQKLEATSVTQAESAVCVEGLADSALKSDFPIGLALTTIILKQLTLQNLLAINASISLDDDKEESHLKAKLSLACTSGKEWSERLLCKGTQDAEY